MPKPIETIYNGYRFRSRLEARWAVFFDVAGIEYMYEVDGYPLQGLRGYLPDFWLPKLDKWIEIKPTVSQIDGPRMRAFSREVDYKFYILVGDPYPGSYSVYKSYPYDEAEDVNETPDLWLHCPLCKRIDLAWPNGDPSYQKIDSLFCDHCDIDDRAGDDGKDRNTPFEYFHEGVVYTKWPDFILKSPRLMNAYTTARQARF